MIYATHFSGNKARHRWVFHFIDAYKKVKFPRAPFSFFPSLLLHKNEKGLKYVSVLLTDASVA